MNNSMNELQVSLSSFVSLGNTGKWDEVNKILDESPYEQAYINWAEANRQIKYGQLAQLRDLILEKSTQTQPVSEDVNL